MKAGKQITDKSELARLTAQFNRAMTTGKYKTQINPMSKEKVYIFELVI